MTRELHPLTDEGFITLEQMLQGLQRVAHLTCPMRDRGGRLTDLANVTNSANDRILQFPLSQHAWEDLETLYRLIQGSSGSSEHAKTLEFEVVDFGVRATWKFFFLHEAGIMFWTFGFTSEQAVLHVDSTVDLPSSVIYKMAFGEEEAAAAG